MARVIFHVDLNSFFAVAETLLDPSLQGKPVAVSGMSRRSVVSTASYEARKYGVNSAMPIGEALKRCPDLIVVSGHHSYYRELSQKFIHTIQQYTDLVEQASIDECYADMTEAIRQYPKPLDLAWKIQQELFSKYGLKCSIGVAPNKFLAKMASDMKKPMGITILRIQEVKDKLWHLPIEEMRGIGKKTAPLMHQLGIHTIGDLAQAEAGLQLKAVLGKNTEKLIRRANGLDDSQIVVESDAKSLSQSTTFENDITTDDYDLVKSTLYALSQKLMQRVQKEHLCGLTVSITIKYFDFTSIVRSMTLDTPIETLEQFYPEILQLFDENAQDEMPIRLLGVGLSNLKDKQQQIHQLNLFEPVKESKFQSKESSTDDLVEQLNHQLKQGKITTLGQMKRQNKKGKANQ